MFEYATVSYWVSCLFYVPYKLRLLQKYVAAVAIVWEGPRLSLKIQSQFGHFLILAATAFLIGFCLTPILPSMTCYPVELEHILHPKTGDFQRVGGGFPETGLFPSDLVGTLRSAYIDTKFSLLYCVFSYQTYSCVLWKPHLFRGLCTDPVLYPARWAGCRFIQSHCNMVRLGGMSKSSYRSLYMATAQ